MFILCASQELLIGDLFIWSTTHFVCWLNPSVVVSFKVGPENPGESPETRICCFFFDLGASHSVEWWQLARGRAWRIPFCRDVGFKKCISGQISHPLTSYFMLFQGTIYIGTRVDMFWLIAISQTHKSCSFFRSSEGRGNFQVPRSQRPKFLWEIPWWRSVCKMHSSCDFQKSCFFLIAKLFFNQANYGLCMLLQICPNRGLPVVPHKAVAEVSKIGNL